MTDSKAILLITGLLILAIWGWTYAAVYAGALGMAWLAREIRPRRCGGER